MDDEKRHKAIAEIKKSAEHAGQAANCLTEAMANLTGPFEEPVRQALMVQRMALDTARTLISKLLDHFE